MGAVHQETNMLKSPSKFELTEYAVTREEAEKIAEKLVTLGKEDDPRWIANVVMIAGYRVVASQLKTDAVELAKSAREAIVQMLLKE